MLDNAPTERTITQVEIFKFFKDHGVEQNHLTTKDVTGYMKLINEIFLLRLGAQSLEYAGFVQLIIQTAIFIHRKGRSNDCSAKDA